MDKVVVVLSAALQCRQYGYNKENPTLSVIGAPDGGILVVPAVRALVVVGGVAATALPVLSPSLMDRRKGPGRKGKKTRQESMYGWIPSTYIMGVDRHVPR
ncbi:hypothetical protein LX32DRAFT_685462 [Colletotrichum zoysiae]|uniref:Uncharacterized protein n=1 Tax=Colletotrichum zoysiae TaxID=1216348 RepID=A0AAD9M0X6_9PEZI|nr:hypothetical protein LX32DRAFT_685462 [Colletotrichum zoysiae]